VRREVSGNREAKEDDGKAHWWSGLTKGDKSGSVRTQYEIHFDFECKPP